jgi:predicted dehydrogenase
MLKLTRRRAIQTSAVAAVTFYHGAVDRRAIAADSPNEKLNVACIGIGGRGAANVGGVSRQNIVALVDVDEKRGAKSFESHRGAKRFVDYRKMLDSVGNQIDAVVISTPDHTHFHPAMAAMQLGKHVYLEKPLAHNVWESRTLCEYATANNLATQLGNQRHAMDNMHRVVELVQSGAIGKVSEVYSWIGSSRGMPDIPKEFPPVPDSINYELWLGPVAKRPYHPSFCPYGWRFWWDFGTGETGNWGCHILDIPYWSLGLRFPNRVDATGPDVDAERTPKSMQSVLHFPGSNQRSPVTLHWGQGEPAILKEKGLSAKGNNTLFIGDQGMLLCGFSKHALLPEAKFFEFKAPPQTIATSPGFHNEWIAACKGGEAATCNFDYTGPMAESVLLANVAYRAGGFDWDAKAMTTGDNANAQALIKESYRPGWEV